MFRAPGQFEFQLSSEKKETLCYFHRCEKAVESILICVFLQASESARTGMPNFAPVASRAARLELPAHVPPL